MSSRFGAHHARCVAALMVGLAVPSAAQKPAEFKIKDRRCAIDYVSVPSGRHGLEELNVGGSWRMGAGGPTTLAADLPILSGDRIIAPGGYLLTARRVADQQVNFELDQAGAALGGSGALQLDCEMTRLPEKAKKLDIVFNAAGKDEPGMKPAKIVMLFAQYQVTAPVKVVAAKPAKAGEWQLDVFTYPKDVIAKRLADGAGTPICTLRRPDPEDAKKTLAYNAVITKDSAKLIPWTPLPVGRANEGQPPDAAKIRDGKVEWSAAQKPVATCDLEKAEFKKNEGLTLRLICGDQLGVLTFPDPLKK
ncbi:MAG TPA: hypothetical protein VEI02_03040 [Planctomycetota bacterium]|nr:hypothetical protein [Planctomycetota bacterium]